MKTLESHLKSFGLSKKETEVYIALLSKGPSTILNISRNTSINRSTVHILVEKLIKKGLVSSITKEGGRIVIADPPEKLKLLLLDEKLRLESRENALQDTIDLVYDAVGKIRSNTLSSVRLYEGLKSVNMLYDEVLIKSRELRAYVNFSYTKNFFPDNFRKFSNAINSGLVVYDLYVGNDIDEYKEMYNHPNYHSKPLHSSVLTGAMDYIIANNAIIIVYVDESPKAVVIEDRLLCENAKNLFDLLWSFID